MHTPHLIEIRLIVKEELEELIKEEIKPIKAEIESVKTEIESVKEEVAWIRGKLDTFEKHVTWLLALIAVAAVVPPIAISWRSRKDRLQERQIETLMNEIEKLNNNVL